MKVISVLNLKGGVGKTITTASLACELKKRGNKILLLDNDKQGNLSKYFDNYEPTGFCPTAKALSGEIHISQEVRKTKLESIDIIPANMSLKTAENALGRQGGIQFKQYEKLVQQVSDKYDCLIIDNPPDVGLNVVNALAITDYVIVTLQIDEWALEGLEIVKSLIDDIKNINSKINILGVIVTVFRRTISNIVGLNWLQENGNVEILGVVRYSEKVVESTFNKIPITYFSPRSAAAQDYKKVVSMILQKIEEMNDKYERI